MPAGHRDQSAAALPICGGLETATARFTLRGGLIALIVVRVIRRLPDLSSVENG